MKDYMRKSTDDMTGATVIITLIMAVLGLIFF